MSNRSANFYWETVVFKVEETLFRVPRHGLEQASEVFADMFRMPTGPDVLDQDASSPEGCSDDKPILLEGYKSSEFNSLMKYIYPSRVPDESKGGEVAVLSAGLGVEGLNEEEWIDILKLANIWQMESIRNAAIHELSVVRGLTPIKKIVLGRQHRIAQWIEEGLTSLVTTPVDCRASLADLHPLGWETSAKILSIQQQLDIDSLPRSTPTFRPKYHFSMAVDRRMISFPKKAVRCRICEGALLAIQDSCAHCGITPGVDDTMTAVGRRIADSVLEGWYWIRLKSIVCPSALCSKSEPYSGWRASKVCPGCQYVVRHNDSIVVGPATSDMGLCDTEEVNLEDEVENIVAGLVEKYFGGELKCVGSRLGKPPYGITIPTFSSTIMAATVQ
ncbi:hypothetical protein DFP72DRAFT_1169507 [Ephemerocybe angulata]|uniref:BTB domain-containing protein n=1 Tax=Ephemerocybe angulata TaxID=980116 RepID=A0A8H6I0H7_9AGAR|nr:hypothetical protein DFP72DRAFT_1169507 [Tulosesus angulatus]